MNMEDDTMSVMSDISEMNWIDDEEMEDEFFNKFYTSSIESIQIVQILLNSSCDKCLGVSRSNYQLNNPGILKSEEIIPILRCQTNMGFKPLSLLKYVVEIETTKLSEFVESDMIQYLENPEKILQEISYMKDVIFNETIKAFEPLTTLFIIYKRREQQNIHEHTSVDNNKPHSKKHKFNKTQSKNRQTRVIKLSNTDTFTEKNHTKNFNQNKHNKTRRKSVTFYFDD